MHCKPRTHSLVALGIRLTLFDCKAWSSTQSMPFCDPVPSNNSLRSSLFFY